MEPQPPVRLREIKGERGACRLPTAHLAGACSPLSRGRPFESLRVIGFANSPYDPARPPPLWIPASAGMTEG